MALTRILNMSNIFVSTARQIPLCSNGFIALSRLKINSVNLVCTAGKKTIAEELGLPDAPKRPNTPFVRFLTQELKTNSELALRERFSKLAKEWKTLDVQVKAKFNDEYQAEIKDYKEKYSDYMKCLTPDQYLLIQELRRKRKYEKDVSQKRKKYLKDCRELEKPKHPGNAFNLYIKDIGPQIPAGQKNYLRVVADRWRDLPEDVKATYKNESRERLKIYREKLISWEQKMREIGRNDLLDKMSLSVVSKTAKKEER